MTPLVSGSAATGSRAAGIKFATGALRSPAGGVVVLHRGGEPLVVSWLSGSSSGYVEIPEDIDAAPGNITAMLYYTAIENATPIRLSEATLVPSWSWHEGQLWATDIVSTVKGDVWYFQGTDPSGRLWSSHDFGYSFDAAGSDFRGTFVINPSFTTGLGSVRGTPFPC